MPTLVSIYVSPAAGAPMLRVPCVEAVVQAGLAGDRYALRTGHYSRWSGGGCQVTLIEAEALERMEAKFGVPVSRGEHRRNLVTRGLDLGDLVLHRIRIGPSAVFEFDRSRPPCSYLARLNLRPTLLRAMGEGAGVGMFVLTGGVITEGDEIVLLDERPSRPHRRLP